MVISNSLAKKRMQFLLLLIRQERDTVSYFNTWNLYGLKEEYGNVWKLPSRVSLVRASVFFFWARIPFKRLPARQSLVPRAFGFLIAATKAAKYEAEYEAITRLNDCD